MSANEVWLTNDVNDVHSLLNGTEDNVSAIQPASDDGGDEELRAYDTALIKMADTRYGVY